MHTLTLTHAPHLPRNSRPIPHTTSQMHSDKSSPKKQQKSTALKTSLRWRSTQRAPSKRWSINVCIFFSTCSRASDFLAYTNHQIFFFSGPEWHDGHHDAGPRVRHSWCRRGHVLCRDHEVRHDYPSLRTSFIASHIWWPYRFLCKTNNKRTGTSNPWNSL